MAKAAAPDPKIEAILDELKELILLGMKPKTFDNGVEEELRKLMRPKVKKRIDDGGVWENERDNPLICGLHMGQIAKLLAKGSKVTLNVAVAAFRAAQNDEHCTKGAGGGGDWCA